MPGRWAEDRVGSRVGGFPHAGRAGDPEGWRGPMEREAGGRPAAPDARGRGGNTVVVPRIDTVQAGTMLS